MRSVTVPGVLFSLQHLHGGRRLHRSFELVNETGFLYLLYQTELSIIIVFVWRYRIAIIEFPFPPLEEYCRTQESS